MTNDHDSSKCDTALELLTKKLLDLTRLFEEKQRSQQSSSPYSGTCSSHLPTPGGVDFHPPQRDYAWNSRFYPQICGFCSFEGHFLSNCPVGLQYVQQGKILRSKKGVVSLPDSRSPLQVAPGRNLQERVDNYWSAQEARERDHNARKRVSTCFLEHSDDHHTGGKGALIQGIH